MRLIVTYTNGQTYTVRHGYISHHFKPGSHVFKYTLFSDSAEALNKNFKGSTSYKLNLKEISKIQIAFTEEQPSITYHIKKNRVHSVEQVFEHSENF